MRCSQMVLMHTSTQDVQHQVHSRTIFHWKKISLIAHTRIGLSGAMVVVVGLCSHMIYAHMSTSDGSIVAYFCEAIDMYCTLCASVQFGKLIINIHAQTPRIHYNRNLWVSAIINTVDAAIYNVVMIGCLAAENMHTPERQCEASSVT